MRILSGIKGDLRLSAGDNDIGDEKNQGVRKATTTFLNIAGIKASALGNHELDTHQKDCAEAIDKFNGDLGLAADLNGELLLKDTKLL